MENKKIFKKELDFAKWYSSIIKEADLIEYGLVKGTIIFKPYAWSIWTNIQQILDSYFKDLSIENCYMPLMIPYSEFLKESKHIDGFAPELFKINEIGNKKIEDHLVIRPTSEIMFCHYFANNIFSYNDLPQILNQWCNVFRVEKNTRPFLRNSEFFWQEQHGAFETEKEAMDFTKKMINLYKKFIEEYLCIPVIMGEKTEYERFAGAEITYTIEAIMQDGQALQSGTSHYLKQNFSKNFDIKFQNRKNKFEYIYQNSAGISTRLIGALIMSHSDNNGLILPPKIAPIQIKINTLFANKNLEVLELANKLFDLLKIDFKVYLDKTDKSLGFKLSEGEIKGVPIQINIGPNDIKNKEVSIIYRNSNLKEVISINEINKDFLEKKIKNISKEIYEKALSNMKKRIVEIDNIDDFKKNILLGNVLIAFWDGNKEEEEELKKISGASSRCILDQKNVEGKCFFTNRKTSKKVYFARAY